MKLVYFAVAAFIGGMIGSAIEMKLDRVYAQKAERGTIQWTIPLSNVTGSGFTGDVRIHVLDTSGACIYVVRDTTTNANNAAITAIPKSQLPLGSGCQ